MDRKSHKRMFPGYTTVELKEACNNPRNSPEQIELLKREIAAREAGISKPFVTPQAKWK